MSDNVKIVICTFGTLLIFLLAGLFAITYESGKQLDCKTVAVHNNYTVEQIKEICGR